MRNGQLLTIAVALLVGPITVFLLWRVKRSWDGGKMVNFVLWSWAFGLFEIGVYRFLTYGGRHILDWWLA